MNEVRCKNCNKMLFKGAFKTIQIKCPRCKQLLSISNAPEHPTEKKTWEKRTNQES